MKAETKETELWTSPWDGMRESFSNVYWVVELPLEWDHHWNVLFQWLQLCETGFDRVSTAGGFKIFKNPFDEGVFVSCASLGKPSTVKGWDSCLASACCLYKLFKRWAPMRWLVSMSYVASLSCWLELFGSGVQFASHLWSCSAAALPQFMLFVFVLCVRHHLHFLAFVSFFCCCPLSGWISFLDFCCLYMSP